jgi:hypothetical protein
MLRMASAVSGTTLAICGALAPFASCSKAKARRTHPNLLDAAAQQVGKLSLMLRRDIKTQRWTTHTTSMRQNNST